MASPLADLLRPEKIEDVAGQKHLLAEGKILRRIIDSGSLPNMIFYGPSGVGKTTVANIIARRCSKRLYHLNATTCSTQDIKDIISSLDSLESANGVLLYLDEIQYFNKNRQQILLSYIENGDITLIASTTENPFFYVYNAILSRSSVFEFKPLLKEDIEELLERSIKIISQKENKEYSFAPLVKNKIALSSQGDVRRALNMLELCLISVKYEKDLIITEEICNQILENNAVRYDREGDEHYDLLSAFQKSMRGSDPDAAVYYLARILAAGDLPSACRRLMVCACEDVGLAHPQIIPIVKSAVDAAMFVGLPEARIPLADAVILVATSPKSNSGEMAIDAALSDVNKGVGGEIPRHLKNKHFDGEDALVKGQNYKYPHDYKNHYVKQLYLPENIKNKRYYLYGDNKNEQKYKEYNEKIKKDE